MKTERTRSAVAVEQSLRRGSGRGALAAIAVFAAVGATSCTAPQVTTSEPSRSAVGPPAPIQFETVRSILEDSKGNYWFGSWNQGVCRSDGKTLTYFTVDDGLTDNQIRSIREDRNGVVWFEGGFGLSGFDGEKIITPTDKRLQ
jgi:ligand-binding sensor domain-containing protein